MFYLWLIFSVTSLSSPVVFPLLGVAFPVASVWRTTHSSSNIKVISLGCPFWTSTSSIRDTAPPLGTYVSDRAMT